MSVNIVYPIAGESYPIQDSDCTVKSAYITASFSVTCSGGPKKVIWGFGDTKLGQAVFYDQFSAQFVYKLPKGKHVFWVKSSKRCGAKRVKFKVG